MSTNSPHGLERRSFGISGIGRWPITTASWIGAAFVIAFALASIVLAIFGAGDQGTELALRATATWSFLPFWLAYAGGAIARLCYPHLGVLARHGRNLGVAFASALLVHVGLVLWLYHIAAGPGSAMVFFWVGIFCTYLLVLLSLPRLRDLLGVRLWWIFRAMAIEYIAVAFAADFILAPLQKDELGKLSYLPFALMLVAGAGLRAAAFRKTIPSKIYRDRREDLLIVLSILIVVGVILVLLALDHALWALFEAALGLYGPLMVVVVTYVLLKLMFRGISFIGSQLT